MLGGFIDRVRSGESLVGAALNAQNYGNLSRQFSALDIELEKIQLFKHQGPVLETLKTISESGLLTVLAEIKSKHSDGVQEILIRPILPMTARWEQNGDAVDRLFISVDPKIYDEVFSQLSRFGFEHGVHNSDVRIMKKDFPRPEKLPAQAE